MTVEILGRREDQRLEFKSKDALDEPGHVARAVVGMLNAGGGEVWIGVEEDEGKAVAIGAVPDPERARERLWDHLLETLDPSPAADEVSIDVVPPGADPALLVVRVRPPGPRRERRPYAFRKRGGWHFVRRVGARNHPMSREEIFGHPDLEESDPAVAEALRELVEARQALREPGLWIALQPARSLDLDLQEDRFAEIALDPTVTGNRQAGWHFARSTSPPRLSKDRIEWGVLSGSEGEGASRVEVSDRGAARFWVSLDRLHWKGEEREIWPLALLEYPISAFRIARAIYAAPLGPGDRVAADLALLGIERWGLRAGTPGPFFSARTRHPEFRSEGLARPDEPDLIWEPVIFTFREIEDAPDRCGFRLVRRVYQAFGLREANMPRQYERRAERLILPE